MGKCTLKAAFINKFLPRGAKKVPMNKPWESLLSMWKWSNNLTKNVCEHWNYNKKSVFILKI